MSFTALSSREFARNLAKAKHATTEGPVFITDRGKPTFALLKIEDYYKLTGVKPKSLLEIMDSIPGGDFEFDPPKLGNLESVLEQPFPKLKTSPHGYLVIANTGDPLTPQMVNEASEDALTNNPFPVPL